MKIRSLDFYGFCEQNYMQPLSSGSKIILPDYKVSVSHDKKNIITITDDNELLAKIGLKLSGQVLTLVDAAQDDFELASVELPNMDAISNARYDKEKKEIIFTVKKMDGTFDDLEIEVSDLVDIYYAGKGLEKVDTESGHTFNIKVAEGGLLGFDENDALKVNYDTLVTDDELSSTVDNINTNVNSIVGNFIVNEQKIDAALQAGITNVEKHVDDIQHILGTDVKEPSLKTQIDGNRTLIDTLDAKIKEMPETYSADEIDKKIEEATSGKAESSDVEALRGIVNTLNSSTEEKISELDGKKADKSAVEELKGVVDSFSSDTTEKISELEKSNKAGLEALSSETDKKISELEKSNKADLDALSATMDGKISALEDKKSDKTDLEALRSSTNNKFDFLDKKIEHNSSLIANNAKEIEGAKTRLDKAEASLLEKQSDIEELKDGKLSKEEAKSTYYPKADGEDLKKKVEVNEQNISRKADSDYVNDELSKKVDTSDFTPVAKDVKTLKDWMPKAEEDISNKVNSSELKGLVDEYTSDLASTKWVETNYTNVESFKKVTDDYAKLSEKVETNQKNHTADVEKINSALEEKANTKDVDDKINAQTANMATISHSDNKETYNQTEIDAKCNDVKNEVKEYADNSITALTSSLNAFKTDYNTNVHNDDNTATLDVLNADYHKFVYGVNEEDVKMKGLLYRIIKALGALGKDVTDEGGSAYLPFKSVTYDDVNNLLIFTIDDDNEIKVDLTKLINDTDLVQRKIFDELKNEISSFSSNTKDSISELSVATANTSDNIKKLEQNLEDTSYTTAKALNKLNDNIEDAFDNIEENSIKIKNIEENNSASNASLNELSANVETLSRDTENKINNLKGDVDDKLYVVSKSVNDVNDKLGDFEDEANEKFNTIDKTFEDKSYVVSKAINELKDGLEDAIEESMVVKGTGENSTILKNSGSIAKGKDSIALGTGLVTENENEIALGKYNISSGDTVFSFGIGTSENDRKNAVEINKDGNIYIWSEGKYVCLNEIIGRVDVGETY